MDIIRFLNDVNESAAPAGSAFKAKPLYVLLSVFMPAAIGLFVGFSLRLIERVFGVELGRGGH
jgi:hypothetical protein